MIDINKIRDDFPLLHQKVNGKPLIYFDNAATTQKPQVVIDSISNYYQKYNSNIHRGVHFLSQLATNAYEDSRECIKEFINAKHKHEIIFTKGTTESINLIASSFGKKYLNKDDEIIISELEHHSNIVPWQLTCKEHKASLKIIAVNDNGELNMESYQNLITNKTKLVAVNHISNALGTINPIKEIINIAHKHNIPVLIDGAQAVAHEKVDVQALDCDFYCMSAHKIYGPMGIGVLYGKEELLNDLPPYQSGGEMISKVTFEKTTYNELPYKFEAGTPNVGDTIAFKIALEYIEKIGLDNIKEYEKQLLDYATKKLEELSYIRIIGTADKKASLISFIIDGVHPYDAGIIIDQLGIAIRTGHHCAQPIMDRFKIQGTIRASFAVYNTKEEIDKFVEAVETAYKMLV